MNGLSYTERPAITGYRLVTQTKAKSWGYDYLKNGGGAREFFSADHSHTIGSVLL